MTTRLSRRTAVLQLGAALASPLLGRLARSAESPAHAGPAFEIGTQTRLFLDDRVIADAANLERVLHPAVKANDGQPIRFWQRDAQGNRVPMPASIYASPLYDAERDVFRMWSRVYPGVTKLESLIGSEIHNHMRLGYSESPDGIDFELVSELHGLHSLGDYNSVVTLDEHETDPEHRYKIGYDGAHAGEVNGACLAHSADGIHWTPYNDGKPVTHRAADFTNCLVWDDAKQAYLLYTRTDFGSAGGASENRGMRVMSNADFKANPANWTILREWTLDREGPDEFRRRQLYAMTDWQRHGLHFGLFSIYEWPHDFSEGLDSDHVRRHERDVLNFYLGTSHDGIDWNLEWIYAGRPLIERGGGGAWDKDLLLPANWIVTRGDEHWIYYGGANERHGTGGEFEPRRSWGVGLAKLPLDRFVSLSAGSEPGTLLTVPFELQGDSLEINLDAANGEVAIDVLSGAGQPLDGFAGEHAAVARGVDDVRWRHHWNGGDLRKLRGQQVRLQFRLTNAELYSLRVVDR
ncbi:MAG: hypothetical protein JNG89_11885 [Planctomycetaceae bacterium]|nr:hypothetical protein [Planctomycetaceae bacterium]